MATKSPVMSKAHLVPSTIIAADEEDGHHLFSRLMVAMYRGVLVSSHGREALLVDIHRQPRPRFGATKDMRCLPPGQQTTFAVLWRAVPYLRDDGIISAPGILKCFIY